MSRSREYNMPSTPLQLDTSVAVHQREPSARTARLRQDSTTRIGCFAMPKEQFYACPLAYSVNKKTVTERIHTNHASRAR
ncbi:hypothetical protein BDZ89DRAFT_1061358 [Hymenopellis radicata]|nr:hypothetical protein BDZ89DRAFT_1061358 [Hymenopellis radicata]